VQGLPEILSGQGADLRVLLEGVARPAEGARPLGEGLVSPRVWASRTRWTISVTAAGSISGYRWITEPVHGSTAMKLMGLSCAGVGGDRGVEPREPVEA
jgi:hypothetical protein